MKSLLAVMRSAGNGFILTVQELTSDNQQFKALQDHNLIRIQNGDALQSTCTDKNSGIFSSSELQNIPGPSSSSQSQHTAGPLTQEIRALRMATDQNVGVANDSATFPPSEPSPGISLPSFKLSSIVIANHWGKI